MSALLSRLYYHYWLPRKYGGTFARRLAWFQANESRNPAEIAAWRRERLQSLARHAAQHVPHYRQAFRQAGISPEEIVDEAAFSRLPLLRRSQLDDHLDDLVAENTPRAELTASTTGGSTGGPVKYYQDAEYHRQEAAIILRNRLWTGWRYGDAVMRFWGSPLDVRARTHLQSSLDMLLRNESMIDAYRMDASRLAGWPRRIQRGRPPLVEGYANVLVALVEACQSAGVALDMLGVKAVIATAEMLYPTQRSRLEVAFGCRVFNRYGCREASTLAHECRFGRLHTIDDWVYVEIVGEDGQPTPIFSCTSSASSRCASSR
jgi:phenylacetate-CoA ligase